MSNVKQLANAAALEILELAFPGKAARDVAADLGAQVVDGVVQLAAQAVDWKRYCPCAAAEFHKRMAEGLPGWRVLARYHHRRLALVWSTKCRIGIAKKRPTTS